MIAIIVTMLETCDLEVDLSEGGGTRGLPYEKIMGRG